MAAITALPTDAPRTGNRDRPRARAAAVRAFGALRTAVSTARLPPMSPVLTASSLGCGVISAWETFGRGAAWAAGAVAIALFDWHRER